MSVFGMLTPPLEDAPKFWAGDPFVMWKSPSSDGGRSTPTMYAPTKTGNCRHGLTVTDTS